MNEITEHDGEITPDAARLPENMALVKMENDQIFSMAAARPRNHVKIREDLLSQLDAYPSFAKSVIYCKPVGKEDGKMKYARGLSIRAAEALAEAYGYNRVRCAVTPLDKDTVTVEASFSDYQRGRIWQDAGIVSKFYRAKSGRMERYADDRFYNLVVKAEASRRIREVIVRSVPPGLRSELMEMAERKIDELLDDATIQKIVAHFASKSVTLEMLEDHVGRTLNAGWTKEDRSNLLGLWNGIKDGEFQVGEVFGKDNPNGDAQTNGAGAAAAVGAAMIKPREVPEAAKTGQADKTTSAPEPTKPIPESTTTDSRVDMVQEVAPITNPITNPDQPGRSADEARTNPVPVPNPPPIVPQPSTVPASAPEPEKRRPGRPRKQNPAEAAIGAGNAMPPTQPGTMFPREPGIEDETGDE